MDEQMEIKFALKTLLLEHRPHHINLVTQRKIEVPYTNDGVTYYLPEMDNYRQLFYRGYELPFIESIDASKLDFKGKTKLDSMFFGLINLHTITFGKPHNYEDKLDIRGMFEGCDNLRQLDLSAFRARKIDMGCALPHNIEQVIMPEFYHLYGGLYKQDSEYEYHKIFHVTHSVDHRVSVKFPETMVVETPFDHLAYDSTASHRTGFHVDMHVPEVVFNRTPKAMYENVSDTYTIIID